MVNPFAKLAFVLRRNAGVTDATDRESIPPLIATPTPPTGSRPPRTAGPRASRRSDRFTPSLDRPALLDVGARLGDVLRIMRSRPLFGRAIALGYDRDDLEAEILVRLVARQAMPSRYDPARAGVGCYVTMFCDSVLGNLIQSFEIRTARELLNEDPRTPERATRPLVPHPSVPRSRNRAPRADRPSTSTVVRRRDGREERLPPRPTSNPETP